MGTGSSVVLGRLNMLFESVESLRSLARIRKNVVAFWETGTEAMQHMERGDAWMGALWNGRAQELVDRGVPLAIEWSQAKRHNVMWCVHKGAPNRANAQRFSVARFRGELRAFVAASAHDSARKAAVTACNDAS